MSSKDEEKRAENEATFREANEAIRAAERELDPPLERVPYLCECDDVCCRETIRLTAEEYERIREDGGHVRRSSRGHSHRRRRSSKSTSDYVVVRKPDGGGEVARALDPRGKELMSDEQARRVGLNESLFRQVNEQIESLEWRLRHRTGGR